MAKLLYPHRQINEEEVIELLNFAIEGRKRVKDQLYLIDETFRNEPVEFSYLLKSSGKAFSPETLENLNYDTAKANIANDEATIEKVEVTPQNLRLEPHQLIIYDNQTGVTYRQKNICRLPPCR